MSDPFSVTCPLTERPSISRPAMEGWKPDPDRMEQQVARLADAIGTLKPSAAQRRDGHISACPLDEISPGLTVAGLAYLHNHPDHPLMQMVEVTCHGIPDGQTSRKPCPDGAKFMCREFFAEVTVCDGCHATYLEQERMGRMKKAWEHLCPAGFRDTDKTHAGFPKAQAAQLKEWDGGKSLFLFGPTGHGKTRLAMLMLKRVMLRGMIVGVLWPEKLRSLVQGYDNTTFDHYTTHDVLLMDDVLLTACRESKLVDAVKMLLDVRMRNNKATIFTSQIGTEEEIAGGKEFGEAKSADLERIKAILRRLRETCTVVSFAEAVAVQGEGEF